MSVRAVLSARTEPEVDELERFPGTVREHKVLEPVERGCVRACVCGGEGGGVTGFVWRKWWLLVSMNFGMLSVHVHVPLSVYTHVCVRACVCVCAWICLCACVCKCV